MKARMSRAERHGYLRSAPRRRPRRTRGAAAMTGLAADGGREYPSPERFVAATAPQVRKADGLGFIHMNATYS
jgi:hypothetical protein